MAREYRRIDIDNISELLTIAEDVWATGESRVLARGGEDIAVVKPCRPGKRKVSKVRPVTRDDALFRLVGIGQSGIPGGLSDKKHEALDRAYHAH